MRAGPRPLRHDANHGEVDAALQGAGCQTLDAAAHGMPFDILARRPWWPVGTWLAFEVKVDGKARLTPTEERMAADGGIIVVRDGQEAVDAMARGG